MTVSFLYIMGSIIPTFLFNYFGQVFVDEVCIIFAYLHRLLSMFLQYNQISLSLYKSPWYLTSVEFQKTFLFVHMATNRRITLTAGKILDLNMDTFKGVRISTPYLLSGGNVCFSL